MSSALERVIEEAKQTYAEDGLASDSEALGHLVANWAEGDGAKLLGVILSALEHANLDGLREEIRRVVMDHGIARPGGSAEVA